MSRVRPTPPLADVDVIPQKDGSIEVVAWFLPGAPLVDNVAVVLALDGSRGMRRAFGDWGPFFEGQNYMEAVARGIAGVLIPYADSGEVNIVFFAVGPGGRQVQEVGRFNAERCAAMRLERPTDMGTGKRLLPLLKYIADRVSPRATGGTIGVLIIDGIFEDLGDTVQYCLEIGSEIASGRRNPLEFIVIGVGDKVDEGQLLHLEDMFEGTPLEGEIDLWSYGLASSMKDDLGILGALYANLARADTIVAPSGAVLDDTGNVAAEYPDGLPQKLRFRLPRGSTGFVVRTPHGEVTQDISEGITQT